MQRDLTANYRPDPVHGKSALTARVSDSEMRATLPGFRLAHPGREGQQRIPDCDMLHDVGVGDHPGGAG